MVSNRGYPYKVCPASATTKVKVHGAVEASRTNVRGLLHSIVATNESAAALNIDVHDSRLDVPANVIYRFRVPAHETREALLDIEFTIGLQVIVPASAQATVGYR